MLDDVKKELEEQLEAALKAEQEPEEQEDAVQEGQDAEAEEVKEEPKEEVKEEEKEDKPDDKGAARLRREAAAERKKREELEAKLAAYESKTEAPKEEAEIPPALQEIIQHHNKAQAWQEMESFEAQVRAENPDYDAVAQAYGVAIAQSFKTLNPNLTTAQLVAMTKDKIIQDASDLFRSGHENPAHEMYLRAKEMGFKAKEPESKEEAPKKPDMAKLAANRARSAGMAATSGESKGTMTPAAAAELTAGEFAKLPKAERERIFADLEGRMAMGQ